MTKAVRARLYDLPTYRNDGCVNAVIESPRGCGVKITYNAELDVFDYGKALPVGTTYPYCWGFIPGTKGNDGDPLDILVLTDAPSYPGVVVSARLIGVLLLDERNGKKRERNDRLVAVPAEAPRIADGIRSVDDLPERLRREIEEFFLDTTLFTRKDARCLGWKGPKFAAKLVRQSRRR